MPRDASSRNPACATSRNLGLSIEGMPSFGGPPETISSTGTKGSFGPFEESTLAVHELTKNKIVIERTKLYNRKRLEFMFSLYFCLIKI